MGAARPRAYLISDVTAKDTAALARYRALAARSIEAFGGRYLVRGGAIVRLEGAWRPQLVILVEFPDRETARRWYGSPAYAEALAFRDAALSRNLILLDGVGGDAAEQI